MPTLANTESLEGDELIDSNRIDTKTVRDVQATSGLDPCFRTIKQFNCTENCQWRQHCRKPIAAWLRDW